MTPRANRLLNLRAQLVLVAIILGLAGLLASKHPLRLDLTRDRLHSLDESSKQLAASLERPLLVKVYLSRGLEAPYNNHAAVIRDKLAEYQAYSQGKMQVVVVDPADDPALAEEARKYGLTQLDYTVRREDRAELRKIWMGLVMLYGERQEVLPSLEGLSTLEYDLSSALSRIRKEVKKRPVLGVATGHGEPDLMHPEGPLKPLMEAMSRQYRLAPVALGGAGGVPEEVKALVVVGPQQPMEDRSLYQLDQFLMRGGALAVFLMAERPDFRSFRLLPVAHGLGPWLGGYGVKVGAGLLIDRAQNGALPFPVQAGGKVVTRQINYPLIPRLTALSRTHRITAGLDQLVAPFAAPLGLEDPLPQERVGEVLAQSAPSSGRVESLPGLEPQRLQEIFPGEERGSFPVVVALSGGFRSFFETRPIPPPPAGAPSAGPEPKHTVESAPARLVVGGSADMVANNPAFMLNVCDWLLQEDALIGIRSKQVQAPPLQVPAGAAALAWKIGQLLVGPALIGAIGGARWWRRRAGGAR